MKFKKINKKAEFEEFFKIALLIIFFALASVGVYFLIKSLINI